MANLTCEIAIAAPAKKVWQVLWADVTYRQWTSVFSEGSYAVSDWKEGSNIQFLSPNGSGMYGIITECKPEEKMVFLHKGEVKNFEEQPPADWGEGTETYQLTEKDGHTTVVVSLDAPDSFMDYFKVTFPKALAMVKELAEKPIALTVSTTIAAPIEKVWDYWVTPEHVIQWNSASPDWHTPKAENDVRPGGHFTFRMEARDGSFGFDFGGTYDIVEPNQRLSYTLGDNRKVDVQFVQEGEGCKVTEVFEAEDMHPLDFQVAGWQAIMNNFKTYTESH